MYNSFTVALTMHIVRAVQRIYRKSYIRKIVYVIKTQLSRLVKGSVVLEILNRDGRIFQNSIAYKVIASAFKLFNTVLKWVHNMNSKLANGSKLSEGLAEYSLNIQSGLGFVYELLFFTGIVFVLGGFAGYSNLSPLVPIIMIAIGVFGKLINGEELAAIENSVTANFVLDLFKLDKDGEHWW